MEDCGCTFQCRTRVPQTARENIRENFQKLTSCNDKYLYVSGLIYKEDRTSKKPGNRNTYLFHVRVDGLHIRVCQKTFEDAHDIKLSDVTKVLAKVKKNVIRLDPGEKLFSQRTAPKQMRVLSQDSKDRVIKHVESILLKPEVRDHILKGEKLNLTMLYADYKSALEKEKRRVSINFDEQAGRDENQEPADYNPVSVTSFKAFCDQAYDRIADKLRSGDSIDSCQSVPVLFKTRNVGEKCGGKRGISTPICPSDQSSTKRMTLETNASGSTADGQDQSNNLYVLADDSNESAVYLLPASARVSDQQDLSGNVFDTVQYV